MMRLSEAIRLGAMLKPQAFGRFYHSSGGGTCASGAALDAVGCLDVENPMGCHNNFNLRREFPIMTTVVVCPCGEYKTPASVEFTIWRLNDIHRWTREQIADWVATIEPPDVIESERQPASAHADATNAVRLSTEQPVVTLRA